MSVSLKLMPQWPPVTIQYNHDKAVETAPEQVPLPSSSTRWPYQPGALEQAFADVARMNNVLKADIPNFSAMSSKIYNFRQTVKEFQEAKDQRVADIILACIKTALVVALIASAVLLMGIACTGFGSIDLVAFALLYALFSTVMSGCSYLSHAQNIVSLEQRAGSKQPYPWYYKEAHTSTAKLMMISVVIPLIGGAVLPLYDACTKQSRLEKVHKHEQTQLINKIKTACAFYKQHAKEISTHPEALVDLNAQLDFLRQFEADVPGPFLRQAQAV